MLIYIKLTINMYKEYIMSSPTQLHQNPHRLNSGIPKPNCAWPPPVSPVCVRLQSVFIGIHSRSIT